ncbi:MAG: hypothetical protein ABJB74_14885 [Gemmatimonas sp.]
MPYNRDDAVKYAAKHWNIPCDDGIFWLTNERISIAAKRKELKAAEADGWQPMFVKGTGTDPEKAVFRRSVAAGVEEKVINDWAGLADCAHYLSRCLSAGGAAIDERGVTSLVNTLQARPDTKTLCERVTKERAQRVIDTGIFKKGDMLGYFNVSPDGDFGGKNAYTHSTMFVGKIDRAGIGGVTCHTVARFPPLSWVEDSWWLHDGYTYTLIHFTAGDPPIDPAKAAAIAGWWKLEYGSATEFYFVTKNGHAQYVKRAPKSTKESLVGAMGSAYWFMDALGAVTFLWKSGTVEVWSPVAGPQKYKSMINGLTPGVLTKLG